jgi:hypothetical protein
MTMVVTSVAPKLIVMTVDSAVANDFESHREYGIGRKIHCFDGVGCVATWGERTGNQIGTFLDSKVQDTTSTEDMSRLVHSYLVEEYRPKEYERGDVGFHIAGFDRNHRARFFEAGYLPESREEDSSGERVYQYYDSSPGPNTLRYCYGGRFSLAHTLVTAFLKEAQADRDMRYNRLKPSGLVQFNDFVSRFAAEITKEVGPPFYTCLINQQNKIVKISNTTLCPLNVDEIEVKLKALYST